MAYAVQDNWQHYTDTGTDTRQSSVQKNYTGTNQNNATAFDYFSDSAVANDTVNFNSVRRHWGIRIYVGTAFAATAVTFIWEYLNSAGSWSTLRVKNHNALLSTGSQDIEYTPPPDWGCTREKGYGIRCRIVSVTNITEGGANSTNKVKFNHKAIRVTGTETTITGAITLNNANTYEILPATTSATGLIPIQMSVGLVRDIAKVDVILAGTSAGAGDTVDLTGVDLDGNALTETIDVSGGNATYTSTLAYADLTQVDCNGFTDGTTRVLQKKLGLIELVTENTYILNCFLEIGDGSTGATVTYYDYALIFLRGAHWHTRTSSTFNTGVLVGSGTSGADYNRGCYIQEGTYNGGDWGIGSDIRHLMNTGTTNIQGSMLAFLIGNDSEPIFKGYTNTVVNFRNSLIRSTNPTTRGIYGTGGTMTFTKVKCDLNFQQFSTTLTFSDYTGPALNAEIGATSFTANGIGLRSNSSIWFYTSNGIGTYLNTTLTTANFGIGYSGSGNGTEKLRLSYTFNALVINEAGTPISSATIKITDGVGAVTTLTTDANGVVTETNLVAYSGSYVAGNPSITWVNKSAYTFEIKKAGYRKVKILKTITEAIDEIIVMERPIVFIDQETT